MNAADEPSLDGLRVRAAASALLIVDHQERLAAVMDPAANAACERNIGILIETARRLAIPVVLSEQYPRGLGPTVASIRGALATPGLTVERLEKMEFACTENASFRALHDHLAGAGRRTWVVVGMEAHICVWQTVRGLRAWGAAVHVPADAVISRNLAHVRVGLDLAARAGAVITATETIVFDALVRAGTDDFKALTRLVK